MLDGTEGLTLVASKNDGYARKKFKLQQLVIYFFFFLLFCLIASCPS